MTSCRASSRVEDFDRLCSASLWLPRQRLTLRRRGFKASDGRFQFVDAHQEAFVKEPELIQRHAIDVALTEEPAVAWRAVRTRSM